MRGKPIYGKPRKWGTSWLGQNTSITDIDLAGYGMAGINIYELKHRTPFLNLVQKELFLKHHLIHLVLCDVPEGEENGQYHFEAVIYECYCPMSKQEIEYVEHRKSWRITSAPQVYLAKDEARAIFRGDAPWPCCGRPTFPR